MFRFVSLTALVLAPSLALARTVVFPHVSEKQGDLTAPFNLDTTFFATYAGGRAGLPQGQGASIDLYLYDDAGDPWKSSTNADVCNPCTFWVMPIQGTPAKVAIRLDPLVQAAGGYPRTVMSGFAVAVVGGPDPDGLVLTGFLVNSHTGPLDLSYTELTAQSVGP